MVEATGTEATAPQGGTGRTGAAFLAVAVGAVAMGASPVFVRLADVGPFASAFWRVALALPFLAAWMMWEERLRLRALPRRLLAMPPLVALAGLFFVGDLAFWHLAIMNTTVANATFLAALAPVMVVLGAWLLLRETVGREIWAGLALGIVGAAFLLGSSYRFAPDHLLGDAFGLVTALFFGAYILAVRPARARVSTGALLFGSSVVTAAGLLILALMTEATLFPATLQGAAALLALALVSHAGGQGLLAFALGHLPAAFSSLVIFVEGVAAAALGWLVLGEHLTLLQICGSLSIFAGIWIARPRGRTRERRRTAQ
ncbi:DMT family transporter [Lutibaculum baratangense]|uniref:Permease of the drug/metabolite transporter (DMT) superfamily n=1 Tax=Lutibaculum baratangense AMV1 TaxID=631454 RepID=V4RCI3_9HYPH|nr:DMT family transporter [Lutibaculum baratangense]ESR23104.1 Permease of the drug/metabolite transporter (DMT) superfamily [Lutibaculum baratangense AMV1]